MALLWEHGDLTVRSVHEHLLAEGDDLAYTTVMTIMVRLAAKGLLSREGKGRQFVYRAVMSLDEFNERAAKSMAGTLLRNYERLAIASFVEELARVSPSRLQELRELAEQASQNDERKN